MSPLCSPAALEHRRRARDARTRRRASAPRASGCCAACRPSARTSAPCAAPGSISEAPSCHSMRRPRCAGAAESTAAPAPSPNRQALISTPGSLSRYIAALLTSTQTDSTCVAAPAAISDAAELQVRQRRGAALADEVEGLHVGAQAEPLDDVARQARAQVAGAGADDDGVDRRARRARPRRARARPPRRRAPARGRESAGRACRGRS